MNFLNPITQWQAQNLPDGLSLNNGVISGTPTTVGTFKSAISVSNQLGSDTKNITFYVKYKPGTQKFSILQDGEEVAKVTIPELQAMVQDGTAQERFNCINTQIVLPVMTPELKWFDWSWYDGDTDSISKNIFFETFASIRPASLQDVTVNFCSFRDVTLSNGSVRPGLILQFDKTLWSYYAPFHTGYIFGTSSAKIGMFNRWRYSHLRQWLNSEGNNWFVPAYEGDALVTEEEYFKNTRRDYDRNTVLRWTWFSSYADDDSVGFLDLLPDDLHSILVPTKVVTRAFFDEDNTNSSIEDPEDVDGYDADITYDKVFIPSMKEMCIGWHNPYRHSEEEMNAFAKEGVEGDPWEFYIHRLSQYAYSGWSELNEDDIRIKSHNGEWLYYIPMETDGGSYYWEDYDGKSYQFENSELVTLWRRNLLDDLGLISETSEILNSQTSNVLTRDASSHNTTDMSSIGIKNNDLIKIFIRGHSYIYDASPAPAFVIC